MAGLLDFLQSASNTAASNVSAPVDGLAWLLRKAGVPVGNAPIGGSDWMAQRGLTRPVDQSAASLAGETFGLLGPIGVAAKAPQIARGLLQGGENLAAPQALSNQAGVIGYHGTMNPDFNKFNLDNFGKTDEGWLGKGIYAAKSPTDASAYASVNGKPGGAVFKVDMDMKNPIMIDWDAANRAELLAKRRELGASGFSDWLKSLGHDGVVFQGPKRALNASGERDIQYMTIDPDAAKIINY